MTDMILRDHLAVDRTKLANQRTLLSYIRTSVMFLASGVTLLKLSGPNQFKIISVGVMLLVVALVFMALGIYQYLSTNNKMKRLYK